MKKFFKKLYANKIWLFMVLPGVAWFLIFAYLPMFGTVIAFKDYRVDGNGFISSLMSSDWVGLENFKFLFRTDDAFIITRNTVLYNLVFIIVGLLLGVALAIVFNSLVNKRMAKVYQTGMLFPYFLSWVVVSYFLYSFLSEDSGLLNSLIVSFGGDPISWYSDPKYWPFILIFMNIWKGLGYGSIVYLAAIAGIDRNYYEAAMIDGAGKWQQIRHVTIPALTPLIIILTILNVGKIFNSDFGLFYQLPRNSGPLYPVTDVIDTYVYRGLTSLGDISMSAAAGLYQSIVGFILVMLTNYIVKKIDPEYALF
ncbi:sugar ABC transporter permease [Listeria newyorkensis]|uniref:Sugar ABC transporter permease n=3 Tax=Listeriaceae TaxID=186820 RepID=A0ABX4XRK7_9LIST|nr:MULTISPECIES: sugar ABC transporter permease [Listeria]KGL42120.1 sugar ABC transporter permease [Listeriaceae bacterium FSL A5-0209]EUJ26304.1 ABC transporter permease [Listeria cornellensis FSL F6-0969]KGL38286.1 sugar ABC transporter permease [Listeria newyorkensis]KMT62864.1 ABC transporter permease [Listeria newyorkensis]PNP94398.1 sugar ABC transporter permease [Listeria newyorkensis]